MSCTARPCAPWSRASTAWPGWAAPSARTTSPTNAWSYSPSRRGTSTTVRFLANAHPRIEQRVQQILTVVLLVAAGRGVALVPASARSLNIDGVAYCDLAEGGSQSAAGDEAPGLPVEYAIWKRDSANPILGRVLGLLDVHPG